MQIVSCDHPAGMRSRTYSQTHMIVDLVSAQRWTGISVVQAIIPQSRRLPKKARRRKGNHITSYSIA